MQQAEPRNFVYVEWDVTIFTVSPVPQQVEPVRQLQMKPNEKIFVSKKEHGIIKWKREKIMTLNNGIHIQLESE